uniref:U7 snRNA-associated Sm-like protein LSm11 n=1 Tax=Phallusia mammillata TaxID=59560 RepID=A0A6F9DK95_9ASCI|nr:U7 snRNA-associated Sm-like protein LSm11 [Phallusia mammillata]
MSTDPTSSNFDPLKALYTETKKKSAEVKVYDNVATFEAKLKRQDTKGKDDTVKKEPKKSKSFSQNKKLIEEAEKRDLSKLKEMMEIRKKMDAAKNEEQGEEAELKVMERKSKLPKNVFTSMKALQLGPMSLLNQLVEKRQRCHVYTRNFVGLRGVLVGFIVAFDRFMNLAMVDIDDTFCTAPLGKVKDHQKPLSVSQLRHALEALKLENKRAADTRGKHRATTGVTVVQKSTSSSNISQNSKVLKINRIRGKGKPLEVFHGGSPQLYQRHLRQMYVRGDIIVLITPDS